MDFMTVFGASFLANLLAFGLVGGAFFYVVNRHIAQAKKQIETEVTLGREILATMLTGKAGPGGFTGGSSSTTDN